MKRIILFSIMGIAIFLSGCSKAIEDGIDDVNYEKGKYSSSKWNKAQWGK